jgi:DNA-binding cell septation regulator SpoVG
MTDQNTQPPAARIIEWRALRRNSLLGFARVAFPSGMIISDITILSGERGPWASPPSKPQIDRDGVVIKDATTGKVRYAAIIEFTSREHRTRWSDAVVEALRATHPEAFEE